MPHYQVYRNSHGIASELGPLFHRVDQSPGNPRSHFELGVAAQQTGLMQLALECFAQVTQLAPDVEAGFFNLGNVLFEMRRFDEARCAYEHCLKIKLDSGTLNNLGNCFAAMRDWEQSIRAFDQALKVPGCPLEDAYLAFRNKGKALAASGDWEAACENYQAACGVFPNDLDFLCGKAKGHQLRYEFGQAMECLMQAIAVSPNHPALLCQIADLNFAKGRITESMLCLDHAFSSQPPTCAWHSQWLRMLTHYEHASPERLLDETNRWALSLSKLSAKPMAIPQAQNGNRPLRIGIVCGSLQPRGLFDWLPSALILGDPLRCEWTFYCEETKAGVISDALSTMAHQVVQTAQLSDEDLAALIESSQLDVLIDTIGHGHQTRLRVFAMKPAPIQASWCAFPLTSGLKEMDYIWADAITIPPASEDSFTEQVIRFPSLFCFVPPSLLDLDFAQPEADSRFSCGFLGLPETLTEAFMEWLATVLSNIADAELAFIGSAYRDAAFQEEIRTRIANQSIEPNRIRFPFVKTAEDEFHAYQKLDVALNAFPVGSTQRAFESLWMGVPVLTLLDERFSGRGVASILDSLKKKEWIAHSPNEYFEAVKQIADNRSVHRSQRQQLRSELLASPLCDIARMNQNIEGAVTEMVRRSRFVKVATTA